MDRQEQALAAVDHSSTWGVVVAVIGGLLLLGLIVTVGRRYAVVAIPLVLVAVAFLVARPSHPNR